MIHPTARIVRLEESEYYGTFGALKFEDEVVCWTLEPPDFANEPMKSCIPAQQYMCCRTTSRTFGNTFLLRHVPGRSNILFHPGNLVKDTEGCILLGEKIGELSGDRAVLSSRAAFDRFMDLLNGINEFKLTITEAY